MTIQEAILVLQKEKKLNVPSRFPCRAIMVKNIRQYCELLSELKKISEIQFVHTKELFTNADVMPKYENLMEAEYRNSWLVLTGVSEYLRLFSKNEMNDRRFASLWNYQAPANSVGRIIIPLWGCESQWFDKSLNLTLDIRQKDFYYDCIDPEAEDQRMKITVLSGGLEKYITKLETMQGDLRIGLQEWFDYWLDPLPDKNEFVLLTKRSGSVCSINGSITIHVVSDTLSLLQENMKGGLALTKANCSEEMQEILLEYALRGDSLDTALLHLFNMSSFSGIDVMGKWKAMSTSLKQCVQLWFQLHPDNGYLCHCFSLAKDTSELENIIMLEIFNVRSEKPEWVSEYQMLVHSMAIHSDARLYNALDDIPAFEQRLDFIVGTDRDDRIYLLHMVGKWMRTDYNQVMASTRLREVYPELFSYLNDGDLRIDPEIKQYMTRYKAYKLENTLPVDEDTYFNGIETDRYEMRYTVLSEYINSDTVVLWIDALGIEWMPLLHWSLSKNCDATIIKSEVTQASLPTETEYNDQWKVMANEYVKLDKLDKLAHKGVVDEPDYYACVQDQLEFVAQIHKKVTELMNRFHRVIVTGDHGTSRLAARFFHNRGAIDAPKNAVICSHGRYCKIQTAMPFVSSNIKLVKADEENTQFAVIQNYDHYKKSGFAAGADDENAIYGEIHGGASPEELLVPVIVLDSHKEVILSGKWESDTVKISMKKVRLKIEFNFPVQQLQVRVGGIDGEVTCIDDNRHWNVTFWGIKPGCFSPQVYADSKIVVLPDITVVSALGGGEGDLP